MDVISFKNINKLAIPALIAGIAEPLLSITDTAIVGNIEQNPTISLAAVGIVGAFISMLIWVLGQTRSAISAIVSQYLGANKIKEIMSLPAQAIILIVLLSIIIIAATLPFATQIFKFYNADGLLLDYCISYYKIRVFGFPFTLFTFAVFGTFRGLQNTFYPMLIAIVGALTNIVLDIVLVFGIKNIIPAMHIEGAAYASVMAQIVMAVLALFYLLKKTAFRLKITLPLHPELGKLTTMIANLFVRTIALNVALYFGTSYATSYGNTYIAAYTIALNFWFLGAFVIDGYASAGNILSGKLLGAKSYRKLNKLRKKLILYALVTGLTLLVLGAIFYFPLGNLFTKDILVRKEFYNMFWMVLLMQPICAVAFIFDGMFKGLGEMKYLRNVLLIATFFVFIPTIMLLDHFKLKLFGIWIAFALWILARGILLHIKFGRKFLPLAQKD